MGVDVGMMTLAAEEGTPRRPLFLENVAFLRGRRSSAAITHSALSSAMRFSMTSASLFFPATS